MTKYKLNNTIRSASEVTLTSYMPGGADNTKKDERYQLPELDTNQNGNLNSQSNRNLDATRSCHVCPHSCEFLQQRDKFAASLAKHEYDKFGLNELRVDTLENSMCLCERYNGGCKLCPRPPAITPGLDGKATCLACHNSNAPFTCKSISFIFVGDLRY